MRNGKYVLIAGKSYYKNYIKAYEDFMLKYKCRGAKMSKRTKMFLILGSAVLILIGIAVTIYAVSDCCEPGQGFRSGRGFGRYQGNSSGAGLGRALYYLRYHENAALRLTDEQETKIDKIRSGHMVKILPLRRELSKLYNSNAEQTAVKAVQEKITAEIKAFEDAVKNILTQSQKQELERIGGFRPGYTNNREGYGRGDCPGGGGGYGRGYGRGSGRGFSGGPCH